MSERILVHEIEPGVFVRWPSGHPIMVTFRTEEVVVRRGGTIVSTSERPCEPYQREENMPERAGAAFWKNHSEDELADRRLYRAAAFATPDGKQNVGAERFERGEDGVVRQVFDVEDIPPPPPPPTKEERAEMLAAGAGLTLAELREVLAAEKTALTR